MGVAGVVYQRVTRGRGRKRAGEQASDREPKSGCWVARFGDPSHRQTPRPQHFLYYCTPGHTLSAEAYLTPFGVAAYAAIVALVHSLGLMFRFILPLIFES